MPPGFTTSTFTVKFNNKPKAEGEISLADWEPDIPAFPAQQADTRVLTEQLFKIGVLRQRLRSRTFTPAIRYITDANRGGSDGLNKQGLSSSK